MIEQEFLARQHGPVKVFYGLAARACGRLLVRETGDRIIERLHHAVALGGRWTAAECGEEEPLNDRAIRLILGDRPRDDTLIRPQLFVDRRAIREVERLRHRWLRGPLARASR